MAPSRQSVVATAALLLCCLVQCVCAAPAIDAAIAHDVPTAAHAVELDVSYRNMTVEEEEEQVAEDDVGEDEEEEADEEEEEVSESPGRLLEEKKPKRKFCNTTMHSLKGDYAYEACGAFCKQAKAVNHCKFCKCKACAFCAAQPAAKASPAAAAPSPAVVGKKLKKTGLKGKGKGKGASAAKKAKKAAKRKLREA